MKILYAVQATGNGHISRAMQLLPELGKLGEIDVILSGSNYTLQPSFDIKYKSSGLSLYYQECGKIDYTAFLYKNQYIKAVRDARSLPVQDYDLVLNDFDCVTALACRLKSVPSIQIGHQASFMSKLVPRPQIKSFIGETILKNYAKASHYLGFHFERYDSHIMPSVVKKEILNITPSDKGHISIYLPAYQKSCFINTITSMPDMEFHWFDKDVRTVERKGNILFHPIDNALFTSSLASCHGLITGGGFETPAEALYLGKKLMAIPIMGQYEQQCNAAALELLGVKTLSHIDEKTLKSTITNWLEAPNLQKEIEVNNYKEIVNKIEKLYHEEIKPMGVHAA